MWHSRTQLFISNSIKTTQNWNFIVFHASSEIHLISITISQTYTSLMRIKRAVRSRPPYIHVAILRWIRRIRQIGQKTPGFLRPCTLTSTCPTMANSSFPSAYRCSFGVIHGQSWNNGHIAWKLLSRDPGYVLVLTSPIPVPTALNPFNVFGAVNHAG